MDNRLMRIALVAAALGFAMTPALAVDATLPMAKRTPAGAIYFPGSPSPFVLDQPQACPANQFAMGSSTSTGLPICVQPTFGNIGGTLQTTQFPAVTGGDCTTSAGSVVFTCLKTNGTSFTAAATTPIGTSGANLGLLNTNKTDSGANAFTGNNTHSGTESFTNTTTVPNTAVNDSSGKAVNTQSLLAQIGASLSTNSVLGFRNRLINGDDRIDQKNVGASQSVGAGAVYTDDRFYAYSTGASVTGQRVAGGTNATPSPFRYQFTGAASVTGITRCQRIEAGNSYDMAGQNTVFSVDLANSLLTSVGWSVSYANSTDSFGSGASPTTTPIQSGTFTVTSTLTRYFTPVIAIPSAATTGLQVCLSVGAQTSGTWLIGTEQFEMGSVATSFERRPVPTELALSQRYFIAGLQSYLSGTTSAAVTVGSSVNFPVTLRATPTFITTSTTGSANVTAPTYSNSSSVSTQVTNTTGGSGGFIAATTFSANSEL